MEQQVSPTLAAKLDRYATMVGSWGRALDLTANQTHRERLSRLIASSLAGLKWLPDRGSILDIGSGNGIPVIPLLLARPELRGVLLEPRERRWAFLREVIRELGCPAEARRERLAAHAGRGYDAITVQGVGDESWRREAPARLRPGGLLLWWTSSQRAAGRERALGGDVLTCALGETGATLLIWRPRST